MRNSFFKIPLFFAVVTLMFSCDKDFNEIGSGVVGNDHYGFEKDENFTVVARNQFYGPVQTSKTTTSSVDMPINSLGYYNNSVFGKVRASFVTQLELAVQDPDLGDSIRVKKVDLIVPYFSEIESSDDDGNRLYSLDSLQGNSKIKLSIFESGYYLRDFDPDTQLQEVQKYYSDQYSEIEGSIASARLNDSSAAKQNDQFFFDPAEVITYKIVDGLQEVDTREAPQMKLSLNRDYFREKIFGLDQNGNTINDARTKLVNNNVFKEYFRGLFFKVEPAAGSDNQGSLAQINFGNGKINITYSKLTNRKYTSGANAGQFVEDEDGRREREDATFVLNMRGNTVNFFENEYNTEYISAVTNPSPSAAGDETLWLKGGAGSMAIIDLFGTDDFYRWDDDDNPTNEDDPNLPNQIYMASNGVPDELDNLRNNKWLINDAALTFYVDESKMGSEKPNYRVYLYDLDNRRPLIDYAADATTVSGFPQLDKYVHGGLLEKNDVGERRYTVRLTNHIRNLSKATMDSTNVRLGLVITEDIRNVSNKKLKTPISDRIDRVPSSSVSKQRGVVLHGSALPATDPKKIKLRIYYTKPD